MKDVLRKQAYPFLALTVAMLSLWVLPQVASADESEADRAVTAASDPQGFIYGRITTRSGSTFEGRLRWDGEEVFWSDLFNSSKEDRQYLDEVPERYQGRREPIKIFGITIGVNWDEGSGRLFQSRFGDIDKIEIRGRNRVLVTMRTGSEYEVEKGGDVGEDIMVWDDGTGEIELDWDNIREIQFLPTPRDLKTGEERLYGTVYTTSGEFTGFVQWDKQECISSDKLDGESRDGDMSIPMGNIRAIAKRSRGSSEVTLKDGRELTLSDSNDVDDDNRGIYVDDERFGRVEVKWDAFDRVEFKTPPGSGPSYDSYEGSRPLKGKVTTRSGKTYSGRLFYDVDESETWEFLSGDWRDLEYNIPFGMIRTVRPAGRDGSKIFLNNDEELELEDSADVDDGNAGIIILEDRDPVYVPWDEVERVDFQS